MHTTQTKTKCDKSPLFREESWMHTIVVAWMNPTEVFLLDQKLGDKWKIVNYDPNVGCTTQIDDAGQVFEDNVNKMA